MKTKIILLFQVVILLSINICDAKQSLLAMKTAEAPIVDGKGREAAWQKAQAIITHDKIADINVTLKAIYTDKKVFFLVTFPDINESRSHKSWQWDKIKGMYIPGNDREDSFVFKWNMNTSPVDLSIYGNDTHRADIWFWKACRTDPLGYADDKTQTFKHQSAEGSFSITNKAGEKMYLLRIGDEGKSAYKTNLHAEYTEDILPRFSYQKPTNSRADVQAKGNWQEGKWTIEFSRNLTTNYDDDIQLHPSQKFQFGISRFEISGRKKNVHLNQPLYGSGDITEDLTLVFSP